VVTSEAGERVVQSQTFGYPESAGSAGVPGEGRHATTASTTHHDAGGGTRTTSESYAFDALGRMVMRAAADGSVVRRTYDEVVPTGRPLPVGMVMEETTIATDGLVSSTRSELSEDRAAVIAVEHWSGRDGEALTRTGRVESDVEDGFVTQERVFPGGDPEGVPVVTQRSKQIDRARGTRSVTETVADGTRAAATTVTVSSLVHGGALAETDAVGNVASVEYDEAGRQAAIEDGAGRRATYEYRTRQTDGVNAVTVTDAVTGVALTHVRDVLGRLTRKTDNIDPSGRAVDSYERVAETHEYGFGVERVTDAWGAVTTTVRDVFGRAIRVELPNGLVQIAGFDDVAGTSTAAVTATGDLAGAVTTTTAAIDDSGRVTGTGGTRADGIEVPATSTAYDGFGREIRATDGTRTTSTEYDAFGNPVVTDVTPVAGAAEAGGPGAGVIAEREFDAFGASVAKTLRSDTATSAGERRQLDELGRVVSQTDQRGVTEVTTYTPDGLVAEVRADTGRVTTFDYDPASRALVGTRTSSPDRATVASSLRYDAAGRVIAVFDPADEAATVIAYEYDAFGNVTRTTYPDGREIRHEFDPHGRKTAMIDADGNRTEYAYDAAGAMLAATQTDRDGAPIGAVRYGYDDVSRVNLLERDNGVRTEFTFTSASDVASEITTGPDGVLSEREYAYTPTGNLTTRIDRVRDDAGRLQTTRTDYVYDGFDRLIGSEVREGESPTGRTRSKTEYVPTLGGDLESETVTTDPGTDTAVSSTRRFEYGPTGELLAVVSDEGRREQRFDADGSLTESATGGRYEYDAAGRQIARTDADGVTVRTQYWADGLRREHTTETGSSTYYWDGDRLVNEVHRVSADGAGTASYLIGTTRQARSVRTDGGPASISYYGIDRHGNITDLTDQTGTVTTRYAYTDYGVTAIDGDAPTALPGGIGELGYNPFQYSGEYTYRDGMQALGVRTYDPRYARFLERDDAPLKNRYAYVDLNPITKIDPTGRWGEGDKTNAFLATFGMFVAIAGAALMLTTPAALFTPMGWIGVGIAVGDAVLTTLQVIEGAKDIEFTDQKALETATRVFFAASLIAGVTGVAGALVKRGPAKLTKGCMELMDAVCLRGNADETVALLQAQAKAQTKAHVKASKHRMDDPDFLAENLHTVNGWRVSLQSSKFENLSSMVHGLSRTLTTEIKGVTGMLVDARAASVKALDDAYQYSTAEGMNISLLASEKSIRGAVEGAAKQLEVLEKRLSSELWEGVEGASTASGLLKGASEDLWRLLARKRGSVLEESSDSVEVVSDSSFEDISLGF